MDLQCSRGSTRRTWKTKRIIGGTTRWVKASFDFYIEYVIKHLGSARKPKRQREPESVQLMLTGLSTGWIHLAASTPSHSNDLLQVA